MKYEEPLICLFEDNNVFYIKKLKERVSIKDIPWFDPHSGKGFLYNADIDKNYCENPDCIYDNVFKLSYNKFVDQFSRFDSSADKKYHDFINMYNILYNFFFEILSKNKVQLVIFPNIPHHGWDTLLYYVAKEQGIKTLILTMSIFPGRFFCVFDIDDFGLFNETPKFNNPGYMHIENKSEKKLSYTIFNDTDVLFSLRTPTGYNFFKCGRIRLKEFVNLSSALLKKTLTNSNKKTIVNDDNSSQIHEYISYKIIKQSKFDILVLKLSQIYSDFGKVRDHIISKNFRRDLINENPDLSKKYVYFPLHLQPELTTSSIGGIYVDQLLAIERLSTIIPDDWFIYVKEHPAQTVFMRDKWFYMRLKAIKKVVFVDPFMNTYNILKNSMFASTITGTVGWEAITGGKNVLIFGNAWYKCLPGVFLYNPQIDINDIINNKIDHEKLEFEFNELMKKTGTGVIHNDKGDWVENFNYNENLENIVSSIEKLLKEIKW
ncbi:MAG: hypothetical protein WC586_01925 [Methanoregula sp.]